MSTNKKLGIGLTGISLAITILVGIYLLFSGESMLIAVFAWPALGFIVGIAIIFFSFIQIGLQIEDEIDEFPQLVEDDITNLRRGKITPAHIYIAVTLLAICIEAGLLLWYRKLGASWGGINVLLIALVVVTAAFVHSIRSSWFQIRRNRLASRIFIIPAVGWLICILIGISYAEPREFGGESQLERTQEIQPEKYSSTTRTPSPVVTSRSLNIAGDAITDMDCDGEECLVGLLIVVVAVSILASATIPHFWVVTTLLLLTFMVVISLRELLYKERFG